MFRDKLFKWDKLLMRDSLIGCKLQRKFSLQHMEMNRGKLRSSFRGPIFFLRAVNNII